MDDTDAANRLKTDLAHDNHNVRGTLSNEYGVNNSNDRRDPGKRKPSPNDKTNNKTGGANRGPSPGTGKNLPDG